MVRIFANFTLALAAHASAQLSVLSAYTDSVDICGNYQGRLFHKFKVPEAWQPGDVEFLSGGLEGPPTCVSWGGRSPFRLDAFYACAGGAVCHRYYDGSSWQPDDGPEGPGENLGGEVSGRIAAATAGPGHFDLVARGTNGSYFSNYFDGNWHEWVSLGGDFWGEPAIARVGDQLHIFGVSTFREGKLLHKYYDNGWKPSQYEWEDLSDGKQFRRDVTVTSWGPSRFDIFALGLKRDLQHKYYQTDHYSEWESLGGDRLIGKPAVASPRADAFDIVVSRNAGSVARSYLSKAYDGSRWIPDIGGYYNQTGVFAGEAAAVSWSNTTVAYFGVSTPEDQLVFRLWWGAGWFPEDGSWFKLADLAKGKDAVAQGSGPEMEL